MTSESQTRSTAQRGARGVKAMLHCTICGSTYSRQEHLRRHMAMHMGEKPFECSKCQRCYSRRDVWVRHQKGCRFGRPLPKERQPYAGPRACQRCSQLKLCCSENHPCDSCTMVTAECLPTHTSARTEKVSTTFEGRSGVGLAVPSLELGSEVADVSIPTTKPTVQEKAQSASGHEDQAPLTQQSFSRTADLMVSGSESTSRIEGENEHAFTQLQQDDSFSSLVTENDQYMFSCSDDFQMNDIMDLSYLDASLSPLMGIESSMLWNDVDTFNQSISESLPLPTTIMNPSEIQRQTSLTHYQLPDGLDIFQLDPYAGHCSAIKKLQQSSSDEADSLAWFTGKYTQECIWAYFKCFHRHVPIVHLPSWNVGTIRSHLFFCMVIIGSFYTKDVKTYGPKMSKMYRYAEKYAWEMSKSDLENGELQLDTLQALYLLALLDCYYRPSSQFQSTFDFKRLISLTKESGYLEDENDSGATWEEWAEIESCRRTTFMLYLLDVARVIFYCEKPLLLAAEVRRSLPTHDQVFSAATEDVWRERLRGAQDLSTTPYPLIFWFFLTGRSPKTQMKLSTLGAYVVLHGLLVFVWETAQIDPAPCRKTKNLEDKTLAHEISAHRDLVIDNALRLWREVWNDSSQNQFSVTASGQSQENALVYWYLACLLGQHDSPFMQYLSNHPNCSRYWVTFVPRVVKNIIILARRGDLDHANTRDRVLSSLPGLLQKLDAEGGGSSGATQGSMIGGRGNVWSGAESNNDHESSRNTSETLGTHNGDGEAMDEMVVDFILPRESPHT